jgi:hypothetical protein
MSIVIYDSTGNVYLNGTGFPEPQGEINYTKVNTPKGMYLERIDVSVMPHAPVFGDIPKSEIEQLKEEVEHLKANQAAMLSGISE